MWKTILDLFFPINCLGCGREGRFICPACLKKISLNQKTMIRFKHDWPLAGLVTASHYERPLVKEAIHRYKYDFIKDLAEPLGQLMVKALREGHFENALLIPIPLHKKRLKWRGFNQAELLAQVVSRQSEIPLAKNILKRTKYRLPQMAIKSSQQRKENIKGAFELTEGDSRVVLSTTAFRSWRKAVESQWQPLNLSPKKHIQKASLLKSTQNKTIILVDDVATTGATLTECARLLKSLRPKQIWGLVIAHG